MSMALWLRRLSWTWRPIWAARRKWSSERVLEEAKLSADDIAFTVATGYGRYRVTFGDLQVTEISCHARGAVAEFPGTRTVLDIGGQDTKAIRIGDAGEVT